MKCRFHGTAFHETKNSPTHCAEISMGTVTLNGKRNLIRGGYLNIITKQVGGWMERKPACAIMHSAYHTSLAAASVFPDRS
jgi:hypothetical protein